MADFDWKRLVAGIAPVLGSALGGPLVGAAVAELGAALLGNRDATETDLAAALSSGRLGPEQIVAIKQAANALTIRMRELDIDVLKINQAAEDAYLRDVQDARARQVHTGDYMPQVIFFLAFIAYVGQFLLFIYGAMPADEFTRALVTRAFGTIDGVLLTAIAYFVGSSRGSKASGDAVRKIAEQAGGK